MPVISAVCVESCSLQCWVFLSDVVSVCTVVQHSGASVTLCAGSAYAGVADGGALSGCSCPTMHRLSTDAPSHTTPQVWQCFERSPNTFGALVF